MKDKLNNEEQKENELTVEKKTDSNSELEASKSSPEVPKSKKDIKKKVVKKRLRIIAPVDSSDEEEPIRVCIICVCVHICVGV